VRHLLLCLLIAPVLTGCFDEPRPACAFLCGPTGGCPDGYTCGGDDDRCHRVEAGGSLAVCEDQLPGDGGAVDAASDGGLADASMLTPDAAPMADATPTLADAAPADAMPANDPPVLGDVADQSSRAGTTILRTLSATDTDVGQSLSFSAVYAGTNRDPFVARAGDLTDTVGASFNPTTHVFTLDSTCLGRYDVEFTVSDGAGGSDNQVASYTYTAFPVLINEVQLGASNDLQNIELINTGDGDIDVGGLRVCAGASCFALPPGTTIAAAGGLLTIHDDVGMDDAFNVFAAGALGAVDIAAEIVLLDGTDDLSRSCKFLDYLTWNAAASRATQAAFAGQWPSASAEVDITGIVIGTESIARTAGANSETPADFGVDLTPTLGAANN
jgi:hypothetical protein